MVGISGASAGQVFDASTAANQAAVLNGLNACNTSWRSATGLNGYRGIFWEVGANGMTLFNTVVPPNSNLYKWGACRASGGGWPDQSTFSNASSNHSGGVNTLMCDGSVRFVKSTIAQNVWWGLGTRANGEVIDANSY
jgi:prepilin-type processing-associated H-X9-DG protein